jgi:pimeloyl-ACP methyl ester carboxylesterase
VPIEKINGVALFIEEFGTGEPMVLVHGSWVDHTEWPYITPMLSKRFRVITHDRRGHSQSERVEAQGSIREGMADLAAIIEMAGPPAHVVGISMGATISLRLAGERPELVKSLAVHEPPALDLLRDEPQTALIAENLTQFLLSVASRIAAGDTEGGARQFTDMVVSPNAWDTLLTDDERSMILNNAPTFLDETRDPEIMNIDTGSLSRFTGPVLITDGSESPPFFSMVLDRLHTALPNATRRRFAGAGHIPHVSHPQEYVQALFDFIDGADVR